MFGELKSLDVNRRVADLPSTFNYNNEVIRDEFNYLFDTSNNYFKQSLNAPRGFVKAHWGDFVNLHVANLRVDNLVNESGNGSNSSFGDLTEIEHKNLLNRFSWQLLDNERPYLNISNYAHDTEMIVSYADDNNLISFGGKDYNYPLSLREELNLIESNLDSLAKNITIKLSNDEIYNEMTEDFEEGSDDLDLKVVSLPVTEQDFRNDVENRLKRIESRLSLIEFQLDNTKNNTEE